MHLSGEETAGPGGAKIVGMLRERFCMPLVLRLSSVDYSFVPATNPLASTASAIVNRHFALSRLSVLPLGQSDGVGTLN